MVKHAIEVLCLHKKNQNSTRIRRRLHRFYKIEQAKEYINNLNEFSKVLHLYKIGIDKNGHVYYKNEVEGL